MLLRHRWFAATALGAVTFALVYVTASSLGITGAGLSAGAAPITSCDPDGVTTAFGAPSFDGTAYVVGTVTVSGIDRACVGRDLVIMLADGAGTQLAEQRHSDVTGGGYSGSGDALTIEFDFGPSAVRSDDVQTVFVSIF
jgi:hypothetical protein